MLSRLANGAASSHTLNMIDCRRSPSKNTKAASFYAAG
jgi:hypothetical protein